MRLGWFHAFIIFTVIKNQRRPGGKDEEEDGPLKEGVVNDVMDDGAEEVPLGLEPGSLAAGTAPDHRKENNQVNDNIDTLKLSKHKSQSGSGIVGVVIYECLSIPGRVRLHFHAQLGAARLRSGRGGCL